MNDDTLTFAFGRMADAIEPPAAAEQLIITHRARIRRRRHLTNGFVAASVLGIAATGGAVASSMGDPGPNPSSPASAEASETATVENSAAPACPGGKRIWSLAELQSLSDEVLEAGTLLSIDLALEGGPPRAWVTQPDGSSVMELRLKKVGEQFEIAAATPCAD